MRLRSAECGPAVGAGSTGGYVREGGLSALLAVLVPAASAKSAIPLYRISYFPLIKSNTSTFSILGPTSFTNSP